jgi:hypothetical protein
VSGLISPAARAACKVAAAALESKASAYGIADTIVFALDDAQLLQSPETAAELAQLRAELDGRDEAARERWIERQIAQIGIRSVDFRNGMDMDLEAARELLAYQVAAARAMLGDAENYSETKLSWDVKVAESPEMYTIVIQRHAPGALTPHEARQRAEARVAELEQQLATARVVELGNDERAMLSFALDLADDQMASRGDEFTDEDQAAVSALRCLAAEGGERP